LQSRFSGAAKVKMSVENIEQLVNSNKKFEEVLNEFNELVIQGRFSKKEREKAWAYFRQLPEKIQRDVQKNSRSWYNTLRFYSM